MEFFQCRFVKISNQTFVFDLTKRSHCFLGLKLKFDMTSTLWTKFYSCDFFYFYFRTVWVNILCFFFQEFFFKLFFQGKICFDRAKSLENFISFFVYPIQPRIEAWNVTRTSKNIRLKSNLPQTQWKIQINILIQLSVTQTNVIFTVQ